MATQVRRLSVRRAILVGVILVNGPVLGFIASPLLILTKGNDSGPFAIAAVLGGLALAWLWWSLSVPLWRVWAYSRVDDIGQLKERAVGVGLTWPDGHILSRTEIKSKSIREREREHDRREQAEHDRLPRDH
jgi:hypothetical protein